MTDDKAEALTNQELVILQMVAEGFCYKVIAAILGISAPTISRHLSHIRGKLQAASTANAVALAVKRGIVDPEPKEK